MAASWCVRLALGQRRGRSPIPAGPPRRLQRQRLFTASELIDARSRAAKPQIESRAVSAAQHRLIAEVLFVSGWWLLCTSRQRTLSPQFTASMESRTDGALAARVLGR